MEQQPKSIFLSKTFWIQVLTFGLSFIPAVKEYISVHPEIFATVFAFVNVVLRLITKDKVYLA